MRDHSFNNTILNNLFYYLNRRTIFMKKIINLLLVLLLAFMFFSCGKEEASTDGASSEVLVAAPGETYYMVTFAAEHPYWVDVLNGYTAALDLYGAEVQYTGTIGADVAEQVTLIEQIITKQPAGIAIAAANAKGIVPVIERAVEAGISVVNFDAASAPAEGLYGFIGTGNYQAGVVAAHEMAKLLGNTGKCGVVTVIDTDSTRNRGQGFIDTIENEYPKMKIVQVVDGAFDQQLSAEVSSAMLQNNADIVGIFTSFAAGGVGVATAVEENGMKGKIQIISFDTNAGLLDLIKEGAIAGTMAQGTWNMGWMAGHQAYWLHHDLLQPKPNWKANGIAPLPANVDTGISFVTAETADLYYPVK